MATYLSAQRIAEAIGRLSGSRAKAAQFDFLVVKRTFVIKDAGAFPSPKRNPASSISTAKRGGGGRGRVGKCKHLVLHKFLFPAASSAFFEIPRIYSSNFG
jgi:hypothetical protein